MSSRDSLRILGVSIPDVSDFREAVPRGKRTQFFGALARRFDLVGVVRPELSARDHYVTLARAFHPRPRRWRARSSFGTARSTKRTEALQQEMSTYQGAYDLVMQMQTLFAPRFGTEGVPYAIYADNTMALTQRHYPAWGRLSPSEARQWMDLEAAVSRSASVVFTMSDFARHSMIEDYHCQSDRVVTIGAGVNQFVDMPVRDLQPSTPRALFVGGDFSRKGGDVLLEAWRTVTRAVPGAELVIAGPRRKPGAAIGPGVTWVGPVGRDRLAALYQSAHVFVLPSIFEPWGHVFLEAMGHGLPCIGTNCCAMPEIIEDGVTGRLVAPREPEPLAAALIALLTRPGETAEMGRLAHSRVLAGHTWSDVVDRVAVHLDGQLVV